MSKVHPVQPLRNSNIMLHVQAKGRTQAHMVFTCSHREAVFLLQLPRTRRKQVHHIATSLYCLNFN